MRLPWRKARAAHGRARKGRNPALRSTAFEAKPADLIRAAKELRLEGLVAKHKGSLYEAGKRSGAWVKYKINLRAHKRLVGLFPVV
jgi:bifunctional non-homologous end joining protein LigD